jgi:hypothetical protein
MDLTGSMGADVGRGSGAATPLLEVTPAALLLHALDG